MPRTEKQEQNIIPRKTLRRTSGGTGCSRKSRPGFPSSGTFLSCPIACTESLSDEEPHLLGEWGQTGVRGSVDLHPQKLMPLRVTCPPPPEEASRNRTPHPYQGHKKKAGQGTPCLGKLSSKGSPQKRSTGFSGEMGGPPTEVGSREEGKACKEGAVLGPGHLGQHVVCSGVRGPEAVAVGVDGVVSVHVHVHLQRVKGHVAGVHGAVGGIHIWGRKVGSVLGSASHPSGSRLHSLQLPPLPTPTPGGPPPQTPHQGI